MDHEHIIIIADSSPLITLALIGKLSLLEQLYQEICIPAAVYEEVVKSDKPCSRELKQFLHRNTHKPQNHRVRLASCPGDRSQTTEAREPKLIDARRQEHQNTQITRLGEVCFRTYRNNWRGCARGGDVCLC